ncbi:MAG: sulfatase-like hydrolase/transferase, partial [Anaerolineae bacterium]|nr:sulfatase-like hydrolase/transferase [Anaerolineae bacterium]
QQEWAASAGAGRALRQDGTDTVRSPMYLGCNSFVDAEIGRVVDAVHQYVPENTWIIFTSDHGEMLGAHHLTGKGPVMYEEIAHIPLIIECPKVSSESSWGAPRSVETLVSHIDLLPTMMDLAGMDVPPILEGSSLVPVLAGDEDLDRGVVVTFQRYEIEHDSWGGFQPVRAIVKGQYKLVLNLLHSDEFYNLESDPGEVQNLIDDARSATLRDQLHDCLLDWMYEKRDPFRGPVWERRSWRGSRRLQWRGEFRPRPADGYAPEVRDYDTGLPTEGVKIEYGRKKA